MTVLAAVYFRGFVKPVCATLEGGGEVRHGQNHYRGERSKEARLSIVISDPCETVKQAQLCECLGSRRDRDDLASVQCADGPRAVSRLLSPHESERLELVDVPRILDTLGALRGIATYMTSLVGGALPTEVEGQNIAAQLRKQFGEALYRLIQSDARCARHASIQYR